jgi:RHS repeat-associated protein
MPRPVREYPFTDPAAATNTVYSNQNGQVGLQFSGSQASNLSHRYFWNPAAVDQLLADETVTSLSSAGSIVYPLADHLGTIRDLATHDSTAHTTTVANHRRYDSFGNLVSESNAAVDEVFGYTGRMFDEATGLQNNLNRWYDPKAGRWISEDPIGFAAGDTNFSRYVGNAPTLASDPSGLFDVGGLGDAVMERIGEIQDGINQVRDATRPWNWPQYVPDTGWGFIDDRKNQLNDYLDEPIPTPIPPGTRWPSLILAPNDQHTSTRRELINDLSRTLEDLAFIMGSLGEFGEPGGMPRLGPGSRIGRTAGEAGEALKICPESLTSKVAPSSFPRTISKIGDLTKEEAAALKNIWKGGPRSQLPLRTREQLAEHYSGIAKRNPRDYAQSAFNQARADYLLGKGPNPGGSVNDFSERTGIPIFKRQ